MHRRSGRWLLGAGVAAWSMVAAPALVALVNRGGRAIFGDIPIALVVPWVVALVAIAIAAVVVDGWARARHVPRWLATERERYARLVADAGPITPIRELAAGASSRFVGRVEVFDHPPHGAVHEADDHREGGRFLIRDASGAALFDDDCFELWDEAGGPGHVAVQDGDWVEVIGRGRWAPEPRGRQDDYRSRPEVLVLDGTPEEPLHLRLLPSAARIALELERS